MKWLNCFWVFWYVLRISVFKLYVDLILFFSKAIGKKSNTVVDANNITNILKRGEKNLEQPFSYLLKKEKSLDKQEHSNPNFYYISGPQNDIIILII